MIKDNQKYFNRLHVLMDAVVISVSYLLAWMLRFIGPFADTAVRALTFEQYMLALIFIVPGFLILYKAFNLYAPMRMQGRRLVLSNIMKANILGMLLIIFTLYMLKEDDFSRGVIYLFFGVNVILGWSARMLIFYILRDMRKRGLNQKQMILVGYSRAAEEYIDRILQNPQLSLIHI